MDIFGSYPDKRVHDWPLMDSPLPLFCILGGYLYFVYKLGPSLMEKKKPYNLKTILAFYNLGQVAVCLYIMKEIVSTDMNLLRFWKCQEFDYSTTPRAMRLLRVSYLTFWLKLAELSETIFFVVRKKQNQVSLLHVYHHCTVATLSWLLVRYVGSSVALFSVFVNSFVHSVMYSYYLTSLLGSDFQRKLLPIKKNITILQMAQFCLLLLQVIIFFGTGCQIPKIITVFYTVSVLMFFYLFYDFYKKSYESKKLETNNNTIVK